MTDHDTIREALAMLLADYKGPGIQLSVAEHALAAKDGK